MRDQLYDNADSFAMSFDEEWKNIDCEDLRLKIDKVFESLSIHILLCQFLKFLVYYNYLFSFYY